MNRNEMIKEINSYAEAVNKFKNVLMSDDFVDSYGVQPLELKELLSDVNLIDGGTSMTELNRIRDDLKWYGDINVLNSISNKFTIDQYAKAVQQAVALPKFEKGTLGDVADGGGLSGKLDSNEMYALIQKYNDLVSEGYLPQDNSLLDNYNAVAGFMENFLDENELEDLVEQANAIRERKIRKRQNMYGTPIMEF